MNTAPTTLARRSLEFRTRLTLGSILLATFSSAFMLVIANINYHLDSRATFQQRLLELVTMAALQQDGDAFLTIQSPSDAEFERLRIQNLALRRSSPDIRFLYTARFDEEGIYFVVDAGEIGEEDIAAFGERYPDAGPVLMANYRTIDRPMVEDDLYTDSYGTFLTAYAPFYTSNGDLAGIVAIDFTAKRVLEEERRFLFITLAIFGGFLPILAVIGWVLGNNLATPIQALTQAVDRIALGEINYQARIKTTIPEIRTLDSTFARMTGQLKDLIGNLETRVAARTEDLEIAQQQSEKRADELQAIGEISKIITSEQKLEILLPLITRLVSERFGFYHTGIFLLDETRQWAVLQAANSEGGSRMLARGHRLETGQGIVGYVAQTGIHRIALDVGLDSVFFNNPDLPTTRSEMALPLTIRNQVIGVLDVQSEKPNAFTENDAENLSILVDQISITLENARLFERTQQALNEAQMLYRQNLQEGWATFNREEPAVGYHQTIKGGTILKEPVETDEIRQAINSGATLFFNANGSAQEPSIIVPIKLRGQVIGTLNIKAPDKDRQWTKDEINLVEAISERLSIALENARLIQESQRQVVKQQMIRDMTEKISTSINLKNVLQIAVEELGRVMPGSEVVLKLTSKDGQGKQP